MSLTNNLIVNLSRTSRSRYSDGGKDFTEVSVLATLDVTPRFAGTPLTLDALEEFIQKARSLGASGSTGIEVRTEGLRTAQAALLASVTFNPIANLDEDKK